MVGWEKGVSPPLLRGTILHPANDGRFAPVQQLTEVAFDQGRQIEGRFHVAILDHNRPAGQVQYKLAAGPPALRVNLG